jgi:protein-tyrosine phosphatase
MNSLYPIRGFWPGILFMSPRPRGGDWLEDEIIAWRQNGIDTVVSLLTDTEERELDLRLESSQVEKLGMTFVSFPIEDRQVPVSTADLLRVLGKMRRDLEAGKNVLCHCRQGVGRSGLISACLLVHCGSSAEAAIKELSAIRGINVPETTDQERWIQKFALDRIRKLQAGSSET